MNRLPLLRFFRSLLVTGHRPLATAPRATGHRPLAAQRRKRAAWCVVAGAVCILAANVGFVAVLDHGPPYLRDPEYGKRYARAVARTAAEPARPVVAAVGSSRTAMGVRGGVLAAPDPLVLNFALAGSGPVMELMTVRRLLHDGVKPAVVLLEFWPPFLREDGPYHESARLDVSRLRPIDRGIVREFDPNSARTEKAMIEHRLTPWFAHRHVLWNQTAASWLPLHRRTDAMFATIDPWGWLPGRTTATADERAAAVQHTGIYYGPLFANYAVSPDADRALRAAVAECRAAGVGVGLLYLPEAAAFRALMPPAAVRDSDAYLAKIRDELAVPLIDARGWVPDDELPDGFHLTQSGAAAFTKRLAPAVVDAFPELRGDRR